MPLTDHPAFRGADRPHLARRLSAWLVATVLACMPLAALAQTCHISGSFGLNFGSVNANGKSATSSITYVCQNYTSAPVLYFDLCLYVGPGQYSNGQPTRRMINHSRQTYLSYDLFSDSSHTSKLGPPGTLPPYRFPMTVANNKQISANAPIYGLVYPGQMSAAAGSYQEQNTSGILRWRYANEPFTASADCSSGGLGGGETSFNSSGVLADYDNSCVARITAADLDFGQTPPPGTAIAATSTIAVSCPPQTSWRLGLNDGLNHAGGSRRMAGSGGYVRYNLYRDPGRTQQWGNAIANSYTHTTAANGSTVTVTVYGLVPAQPEAVPGNYSDTVTVTLTY